MKQIDNYKEIAKELIQYADNDIIENDRIDDLIFLTNEYQDNQDDENIFDTVYEKISEALENEGYTCRYIENKDKYVFDRYETIKKSYNEIVDYLEKNNYDFEISRSTNPGELPSIYVKNDETGTTFRIANHYNGINDDYNQAFNQIYNNSDYINWKNTILKDMITKLEY